MLEYESDKFILCSLFRPNFAKIDRKLWQQEPNSEDGFYTEILDTTDEVVANMEQGYTDI